MRGFDVRQATTAIYNNIKDYRIKARADLLREFNSPGYSEIFKNVTISEDYSLFEFDLQDGVDISGQDITEVLAQGGAVKKDDGFVLLKRSATIRKYLGKR